MAHAEMNALASLPSGQYGGHTLYTTFEPCFMCAATTMGTYQIPKITFAAHDPNWEGLDNAFRGHPTTTRLLSERECLGGPYGVLAYLLHLAWAVDHHPGPLEAHQRAFPARLALSHQLVERATLEGLREDKADVADVAQALWPDLCRLSTSASAAPLTRR